MYLVGLFILSSDENIYPVETLRNFCNSIATMSSVTIFEPCEYQLDTLLVHMTSLQTTCVCYKYSSIMVSDATKPSTSTLSKVDHWPKPLKVDSHLLSMIMVCSENPEPEYTMRLGSHSALEL